MTKYQNTNRYIYNKETEYLLIYNFQILCSYRHDIDIVYHSLDILCKQITEKIRKPIQLVSNRTTKEVMNNYKAMIEIEITTLEEITKDGLDIPMSYGIYNDYRSHCCFVTLLNDNYLLTNFVFDGLDDQTNIIQESKVFENLLEVQSLLSENNSVGRAIIEMSNYK